MNVLNCLLTFIGDFDIIFKHIYLLSHSFFSLCLTVLRLQNANLANYAKCRDKNKLGGRIKISPVDKAGQGNQALFHGQLWLGLP